MKVFLIVLGILVLLFIILISIPVSIQLSYYDELKYKVKIGFYEIVGSDKTVKQKKKKKSIKSGNNADKEKAKPVSVKKPSVNEVYELIVDFLKNCKLQLKIIVKKLTVYISCGDEDAAQTAILFGKMNAYAYSVDALLKSILKVNESNINIFVDYNSNKLKFAVETHIFSRLGNILLAILHFLVYFNSNKEKINPIFDYIKNKEGVK